MTDERCRRSDLDWGEAAATRLAQLPFDVSLLQPRGVLRVLLPGFRMTRALMEPAERSEPRRTR